MSEIKVNKISPRTACGTTTLGDSGDTFTIPSGVTISNLGTAAGFGGTGEISWDTTVKTTGTFTATSGVGYFLNTTGGTITVNLPAGTAGASVAMVDYAGTWQTSNVTVSPNGTEKMGGVNADVTLNTEGQSVQFVYIDGVQGWINVIDSTSNVRGNNFLEATGGCITTCGNCKMHTFLSPGTFAVSSAGACASNNVVSYMVVAGGGGAGAGYGGGGGGGGFREYKSPVTPYTASPLDGNPGGTSITVSATPYPIQVGGGGTGSTGPGPADGTRGDSSIFSTITSTGGGAGGDVGPLPAPVRPGGSGGGGSVANPSYPGCGGTGNTPPTTPAQGTNGGSGYCGNNYRSGGGGGATVAGSPSPNGSSGGCGGTGATTSISASPTSYSGGGGGGQYNGLPAGGAASPCGTGKAASFTQGPGPSAAANTGGGGGGGAGNTDPGQNGGNGGSGIVIIRYRYQ